MGNDGPREYWRRLILPLGISVVINLILCGALVRLSATPPAQEAGIAVVLEGIRPVPPPTPPPSLLKRLFTPPPDAPPEQPEQPKQPEQPLAKPEESQPTLFNRIAQLFHREDPPPSTPEMQPPAPENPNLDPPGSERIEPVPVNPAPASDPEPSDKALEEPVRNPVGPSVTDLDGNPGGGSNHPSVESAGFGTDGGKGPGGNGGKSPGGDGKGSGADGHETHISLGSGTGPGGGTTNIGPGVFSGTGSGPGTTGGGSGKDPGGTGVGPGKDTGKDGGNNTTAGTGAGDTTPANSRPRGPSHPARAVHTPQPPYPESAREDGIEGTTQLLISLDAAGKVTGIKIQRSSGDRRLDRAAESEVRKWTFEAKMDDGVAVPSTIKVKVVFRLE
jgi:TonB family protein